MQRILTAGAAFALALAMLGASAQAVVITNKSDAWAWVTTYMGARSGIIGAFCVAPGHDAELPKGKMTALPGPGVPLPVFQPPYEIRVEVTHQGCRHPVMLDATLGYDGKAPYFVHGSNGKYAFRHTP